MNKLKGKMLKYFVLCALGISLGESFLESMIFDFLLPRIQLNEGTVALMTALLVALTLGLFFSGAWIFYGLVKKAVAEESLRQVREQNLIYSCIAHDLKTPMTSVIGYASALKDGRIKEEDQPETLDLICRKARHMNGLIESLSAYSRLGAENCSLREGNLCGLVRELVAELYGEFENKGISLDIAIPEEDIFCRMEQTQLRRAVQNLLVNAYTHNPSGTAVKIAVREEKGRAWVSVADSGSVIPKELAERVFAPFVQGDPSRTSGSGSGLGLAIAAKIAALHEGSLSMKDGDGEYTKAFVLELPVA